MTTNEEMRAARELREAAEKDDDRHARRYDGDSPYEVVRVLEAHGITRNAYLYDAMVYLFRLGRKEGRDRVRDLGAAINYLGRLRRVWQAGAEVGDGSIHDWPGDDRGPTTDDVLEEIERRTRDASPHARSALEALAAKIRTMRRRADRKPRGTGSVLPHASDCAVNNAPAYAPGPCDCGAQLPGPEDDETRTRAVQEEADVLRDRVLHLERRGVQVVSPDDVMAARKETTFSARFDAAVPRLLEAARELDALYARDNPDYDENPYARRELIAALEANPARRAAAVLFPDREDVTEHVREAYDRVVSLHEKADR